VAVGLVQEQDEVRGLELVSVLVLDEKELEVYS
jgi:hypothetical protein